MQRTGVITKFFSGGVWRQTKKKPLDPKATVRIAVAVAVWEIIPVRIVRAHLPQPQVVMVAPILPIFQTENVVTKVKNIPLQNMKDEVIGKSDIIIRMIWMKNMVQTRKVRECQQKVPRGSQELQWCHLLAMKLLTGLRLSNMD